MKIRIEIKPTNRYDTIARFVEIDSYPDRGDVGVAFIENDLEIAMLLSDDEAGAVCDAIHRATKMT